MNRTAIISWALLLFAAAGCATREAAQASAPCDGAWDDVPDDSSGAAPPCCFTVADLGLGVDSEEARHRLIIPFIPSSKLGEVRRVMRAKKCEAIRSKETDMSEREKSSAQEIGALSLEKRRAAVRQARANIAQSREVELSKALLDFDVALSASERLAAQRAKNLEDAMGQAYQVIGLLAAEAGLADSPEVRRALDYFAANEFAEDFLPSCWPGKTKAH